MTRYSQLSPLSIDEKFFICAKMLNFFGINESLKNEAVDFLKIKKEPGVSKPFSLNDFMQFFSYKDNFDYHKIRAQIIELSKRLEDKGFLSFAGNKGYTLGTERCFHISYELTKQQQKGRLFLSNVLGIEFVFDIISKNIAHITGENSAGDVVSGSGIMVSNNIILTCAHVVRDMAKIDDCLTINQRPYTILKHSAHSNIDVAFIEIKNEDSIFIPDLSFENGTVLEKVIAVGYPPVPRATHEVLVVQSGEVTGYMCDIEKNIYMLFSAIARPGNSGGPIISEKGRILGIVSQEVKFDGTHAFPFFAAVPTNAISEALQEMQCPIELPIDNYE